MIRHSFFVLCSWVMLMKIKFSFFAATFATVLITILVADVFYKKYNEEYKDVFLDSNNLFFLQQGVYSNLDIVKKNCKKLDQYTIVEEDNKYYVYIGITSSQKLASKIQNYFKEEGVDIYIKELTINNEAFINEVEQYDILLDSSKTLKEVNSVMKSVLATYEEIVLKK